VSRTPDQYADLYPSGFDYLLTAISGVLTSYAVGMSVAYPLSGQVFMILSLLGVWISFAIMRTLRDTKLVQWNGFVYAGVVVSAFIFARPLCAMFPENPFTAQIFVCGALCWMLVFGSFLIWSDQTLLFQSVPSIAIFGLVGCYDTFRDATWMFFGFLLCFATLLARVHSRTMLRQAKESGYSQSGNRVDRAATELQRMRSGPWKWVAGPQWALASAFVVILFSFLGAPIIRRSVQGVTANVSVQAPFNPSSSRNTSLANLNDSVSLRVGRGPNQVSELPVFRATLDGPRYLRTAIYQSYAKIGWNALANQSVGDKADAVFGRSMSRRSIVAIKDRVSIKYAIEPLTSRLLTIPSPGEVIAIKPAENVDVRMDGTLGTSRNDLANVYEGTSIISNPRVSPRDAESNLPAEMSYLTSTSDIPPSVFDLANQVAAPGKTDFDRANLIKQEIESRVKYNLNAAETPSGKDPVEYFLFEGKEGYCDLFASSMALMARSVGIPARMVVGFYPVKGDRDSNGRYILHESERHAWAELFFKDAGWVVFDATEGAEEVPGGERGGSNVSSISIASIFSRVVDVLIGLVVVGVLVLSVWAVAKSRHTKPTRSDLDREYLKFSEQLVRASGVRRNYDQTTSEYFASVTDRLGDAQPIALRLNLSFERLFYGASEVGSEELSKIRNDLSDLRKAVRALPRG
jgi:transglutaminase-like putative cysteine protease